MNTHLQLSNLNEELPDEASGIGELESQGEYVRVTYWAGFWFCLCLWLVILGAVAAVCFFAAHGIKSR